MNPRLKSKWDTLELTKSIALEKLKSIPIDRHNVSQEQGKWTPAQVVYHLILGEELTTAYIKLKIQDPSALEKSGIKSGVKSAILNLALKSSMKFKAPEFTAKVSEYISYDELENRWDKARKDLKQMVELLPENLWNKNIFKHPIIGRINIFQTLSFLENHIVHHLPQISETRKN